MPSEPYVTVGIGTRPEIVKMAAIVRLLGGQVRLTTIYLGSSACGGSSSVVASPVAGGKGPGIGLGLLSLLGAGVATVYVRRRRVFT
jgi:hypothetical protein